jgi:hypothetical protein
MPGVLFWLFFPLHILVNVLLIFVLALRGQGLIPKTASPVAERGTRFDIAGFGLVALRSKRDALLGLPQAWSKRSRIQSSRQASVRQIWSALHKSFWW